MKENTTMIMTYSVFIDITVFFFLRYRIAVEVHGTYGTRYIFQNLARTRRLKIE